ncbi:hypothetical protein ACHAWC_005994 [Mediolabrus comicus]
MTGLHRPSTPPGIPPPSARRRASKLCFGTVCSSNINRSMEAHVRLQNAGMRVESYGTGTQVRLPGKSAMEPRNFKFGTPYADMYKSLSGTPEDEAFFIHNGVLQLCKRGSSVKLAPQRWQDTPTADIQQHDVVIAFEERIYDAVIEDLQTREPTEEFKAIHVICLDTKDNPHEAQLQGTVALELCWLLEQTEDLDLEAPELVEQFQEQQMTHTQIKVLHQICYL